MAIDYGRKFFNLKCAMKLERDGSPKEFNVGEQFLRQFAAEVLLDFANNDLEHPRNYSFPRQAMERRAAEIEAGR